MKKERGHQTFSKATECKHKKSQLALEKDLISME